MCPQLIKQRGRDFLLQQCPVVHVELRGLSHSQAVLQFIKEASSLQDGPVTFYRMRQVGRIQTNQNLKNTWDCNEAESITTSVTWAHDPKLCFLFCYFKRAGEKRHEEFSPSWCDIERSPYLSGQPNTQHIHIYIWRVWLISVNKLLYNWCKLYFLKEVEGKQCRLHDFSWTDIDRFTFQVGPHLSAHLIRKHIEIIKQLDAVRGTKHYYNLYECIHF